MRESVINSRLTAVEIIFDVRNFRCMQKKEERGKNLPASTKEVEYKVKDTYTRAKRQVAQCPNQS